MSGKASWYGGSFHGKRTANGEIFDRNELTAAHRTLPFGTVVRVSNLKNGRKVLLRINDRGPYIKGRVLDVSHRAAEVLRMKKTGVAQIAIDVITDHNGVPLKENSAFYVHLTDEKNPFSVQSATARYSQGLDKSVRALLVARGNSPAYALCLGPFETYAQAKEAFSILRKKKTGALAIVEGPAIDDEPLTDTSFFASLPENLDPLIEQGTQGVRNSESGVKNEYAKWDVIRYTASTLTAEKGLLFYTLSKVL